MSNQARVKSEDVFCMSGMTLFEHVRNASNTYALATLANRMFVVKHTVEVVVVVGQTVWSISSKTLAYDCLYTLALCTASMIATKKLGHLGVFCPVFVQAVLERVDCSAAYNFT